MLFIKQFVTKILNEIVARYHSLFGSVATEQEIEEYFNQQEIARLKEELERAQENADYWQARAECAECFEEGRDHYHICPNCGSWINLD